MIHLTSHKLDCVMKEGDLDEFIDALGTDDPSFDVLQELLFPDSALHKLLCLLFYPMNKMQIPNQARRSFLVFTCVMLDTRQSLGQLVRERQY
ncbi:hypothetical protein ANAPC3_00067 [Anaplasma phagocytophilum]|nr:hypothetical protein ANAPC3_00067 [Anaplasma phagocytophilum]SBO30097.1 hypothetical protein ANAPC4_00099 [Anaplasma phagocytophilum]SBO30310.1 hypothetical protein ANAPC2_00198 [Anaplasma phagocytophilum]